MAKKSLVVKAARPPKHPTQAHSRCNRCGRPRAVYRKFGLCRICLRELAHQGVVHGTAVVTKRRGRHAEGPPDADIIVANDSDVALAVRVADCVPLLMADIRSGAVAAAHAGWRGLALNVPSTAVAALTDVSGGQPSDLVAAIGPSIGSCCYEVGDDVRQRFGAAGFRDEDLQRWFRTGPVRLTDNPSILHRSTEPRRGRWFLDIWTAASDQLTAAGVQPDRILTAQLCTASHADVFCSYRRDGAAAGRLAAVIRPL
jgi:YfiH family protein